MNATEDGDYQTMVNALKWIASTPPLPNEGDEGLVNVYREIARGALPPNGEASGVK